MTSRKKVRIGMIGAGGIAGAHANALKQMADEADLVAVCEIDEQRGKAFQEKYSIPESCTDYRELLARDDIDLVTICTPAFNHALLTCAALHAGKWAICEKPVAGSLLEADSILEAERATGMRAASIFQVRFGKGMRALRELIESGMAGRPVMGLCETFWHRDQQKYYDLAPWRGTWKGEMGGCLVTLAIHIIDALLCVMGEPEWVAADSANLRHRIEVDDCSAATVRFRNGAMASIVATSCNHGKPDLSSLRFVFDNMSASSREASFGDLPWTIVSSDPALQGGIDAVLAKWKADVQSAGHQGQLTHFARAFREGSEPVVSIAEARKCLELIAGIYRSAILGEKTFFPIAKTDPFYSAMNGGHELCGAVKR